MMETRWTDQKIKDWIGSQSWYQRILLSNGLETAGTVDSKQRLVFLKREQIVGRSILDIGCNSGYYCLWAKNQGAARVVGIDIDEQRLNQAKTLAEIEEVNIEYYLKSLADVVGFGKFDIVFCFAVLTEISDLLGSLQNLTAVIGQRAYVEIALARPLLYLSRSPSWLKSFFKSKYSRGILEIRPTKGGWMLSPNLEAVRCIIGSDFTVSHIGKGLRYAMIRIDRIQ